MSNLVNHGGPAFPQLSDAYRSGMTLRDYFAAQALPAVVTLCFADTDAKDGKGPDYFSKCSYMIADAMLKARAA
jgi:hypothetical protein